MSRKGQKIVNRVLLIRKLHDEKSVLRWKQDI